MAGFISESFEKKSTYSYDKAEENNAKLRSTLDALVKADSFKQCYFLYGEETYLIRYYKNALIKAISEANDMNVSCFAGPNFDRNEFRSIATTMPFFSERRVVVLENTELFKIKKGEEEEENNENNENKDILEALMPDIKDEELFEDLPSTTHLIIVDSKIAKTKKIYKQLIKNGEAYEINFQDSKFISRWIRGKLKLSGVQITDRAVDMIIDRIGLDMNTLESECDKLISYASDKQIDIDDIEAITSDRYENKVWNVIEYAITGRSELAMKEYKDVLALNTIPIVILVMMGKQISKYLAALEVYNQTRNSYEVWTRTGVNYFDKIARYCSKEKLEAAFAKYIELDRSIKEGNIEDKLAPELLIAYLAK